MLYIEALFSLGWGWAWWLVFVYLGGCWLVGSFGFFSGGELLVPMRMATWGRISYGMNYSHSLQCLGKPTVLSPIFLQDDLSCDGLVALHFFGFLFDYDYLKENYCQKLIQSGRSHKIYSRYRVHADAGSYVGLHCLILSCFRYEFLTSGYIKDICLLIAYLCVKPYSKVLLHVL